MPIANVARKTVSKKKTDKIVKQKTVAKTALPPRSAARLAHPERVEFPADGLCFSAAARDPNVSGQADERAVPNAKAQTSMQLAQNGLLRKIENFTETTHGDLCRACSPRWFFHTVMMKASPH